MTEYYSDSDSDDDGIADDQDNCPDTANPGQEDASSIPEKGTYYEYDDIGRIKSILRIK